ncbi:hypothetical protein [Escherichia coli]|uniref:hypothetical protein n=2 Tax=Escherichia coli TaxID=562 RepID=UPI00388DB7A4
MFFLYDDTYNFFYYLIKLIVIQPQYICVYIIFFFFNAGIAYNITNNIEDQVCRWLLFASMLYAQMIPPAIIIAPQEILQETEKRQELHESIAKTCKLKALDAQQGGLFGVDKDEWVCPDNKSFYLPEKYRPETGLRNSP